MMSKSSYFLFLAVILLASFLRFWQLDKVPPSLFGDEVDVGYQAYSILKTGKDYMGQSWPVYFHSLAEWRSPLFIYSVVPSIGLFGLNEWGVRVPAALFGLMGIVAIFFLTRQLFSDVRVALFTSLFLAISPWHLQYSRAGFEVSLMLFLIIAGAIFFLKGTRGNSLYFLSAAILLALAPYAYSTASFFLPLLVVLLLVIFRKELVKVKTKIPMIVAACLFFLILLPLGREIFFGQAAGRFQFLSIFQNQQLIEEINLKRQEALPPDVSIDNLGFSERLFHNKLVSWSKAIGANYLKAFSMEFLFINGDPNRRHSVGEMGELYWTCLLFIILGFIFLLKRDVKDKGGIFSLGWLLLAPIASSLTIGGGTHASRLFLMLPPLMIFAALGAVYLIDLLNTQRRRILLGVIVLFLLGEFVFYLHRYWVHYPKDSWRWWSVGFKESMTYIKEHQSKYPLAVMNDTYNHSLLYFLFWTAYPPEQFREEFKGDVYQPDILPGIDGFRLGKFYFGGLTEKTKQTMGFVKVIKPGMLYLISQQDEVGGNWDWRTDHPNEIEVLKSITNPYGEVIYYLVTAKSQ